MAPAGVGPKPANFESDIGEGILDDGQQGSALAGQSEPARQPLEKPAIEIFLERANMVTDGRRRDAEFGSGAAETQMTGGDLKGAELVQRR